MGRKQEIFKFHFRSVLFLTHAVVLTAGSTDVSAATRLSKGFSWDSPGIDQVIILAISLLILVQFVMVGFLVRANVRRRQTENALRESEDRFCKALQITPDAVALNRFPNGIFLDVNDSFCHLTGYEKEQVVGKSWRDLLFWDNQKNEIDFVDALEKERLVHNLEARFRIKNGATIPCLISSGLFLHQGEHQVLSTIRSNIDKTKKSAQRIHQLAYYDQLTSLPNRPLFYDRLQHALCQMQREKGKLALLFFDLDRFKWVNDTMGHAVGDELLKKVAQRLGEILRKSDTLARYGGDEFVLLLNGVTAEQNVTAVAEKILGLISEPFDIGGKQILTSSSLGIVLFPQDGKDAETLLKNADLAMYAAKAREGNNFQYFSKEINVQAQLRHDLEGGLIQAVEKEEFFLLYQPQIGLQTSAITSCEALVRWRHPQKGVISPLSFIPLAEKTGQINPIGEWVLRTACRHNKHLQNKGYPPFRIAVNLSGYQFRQPGFADMVTRILTETGLDPSYLELEMTENTLMAGGDAIIGILRYLKNQGIRIALDDFGTGYSSIRYLTTFPIDRLKIAQSFIQDIVRTPGHGALVEAIIGLGNSLNLQVVAEGVETREQCDFLLRQNCREMQGFFFAPPMPISNLANYIQKGYSNNPFWNENKISLF